MSESLAEMIARKRREGPPDIVLKQHDLSVEVAALPPPMSYAPQPEHLHSEAVPRFSVDDIKSYEKYLNDNGYVVIGGVFSEEEVSEAKELFWQFLEKFGMVRDDPSTWGDKNFGKIASTGSGIIAGGGIGQSELQWYCRTRANMRKVFSAVYDSNDLLTSFDGANIFRPWQADSLLHHCTSSGWMHVDQGRTLRGKHCIQGLVTLTDVTAETGGFCCIPRSHRFHDDLVDSHAKNDDNYVKVPADFPCLNDSQLMPECLAGDMILWDSRTIHCSSPALVRPTLPVDRLLRMASYVCMVPTSRADNAVIKTRTEMYQCNITGTHWPHLLSFKKNDSHKLVNDIRTMSRENLLLLAGNSASHILTSMLV